MLKQLVLTFCCVASLHGASNLAALAKLKGPEQAKARAEIIEPLVAKFRAWLAMNGFKNYDPRDVIQTPLVPMLQYAFDKYIYAFLALGVNVHSANSKGITPLMAAVVCGDDDSVEKLIALRVDVNVKSAQGKTALGRVVDPYRADGNRVTPVDEYIVTALMRAGATYDEPAKDTTKPIDKLLSRIKQKIDDAKRRKPAAATTAAAAQ